VSRRGQRLAIYTPFKENVFSDHELGSMTLMVDMWNKERIFLILILMFHDFQRPRIPEKPVCVSFRINAQIYIKDMSKGSGKAVAAVGGAGISIASNVAGNVVGNVAANATANAITTCCVVQ
jgi:hypothetical protein